MRLVLFHPIQPVGTISDGVPDCGEHAAVKIRVECRSRVDVAAGRRLRHMTEATGRDRCTSRWGRHLLSKLPSRRLRALPSIHHLPNLLLLLPLVGLPACVPRTAFAKILFSAPSPPTTHRTRVCRCPRFARPFSVGQPAPRCRQGVTVARSS